MNTTWVPELGVYLGGPLLAAWNADPRVRDRWASRPPACMGRTPEPGEVAVSHTPSPDNPRDGRRCIHLQVREEFREGCRGWTCRHGCELGLEAVPGVYCQTCDRFDDDGPF